MQFGMGLVARGKHHIKLGKTSDSWVYCFLLLILHCLTLFYDRHSLEKMAFTRAVHATTYHVDSSTKELQPTNMDEFALFSENSKWYQCTFAWTSSHPNPWVLGDKGKVRYLKIFYITRHYGALSRASAARSGSEGSITPFKIKFSS